MNRDKLYLLNLYVYFIVYVRNDSWYSSMKDYEDWVWNMLEFTPLLLKGAVFRKMLKFSKIQVAFEHKGSMDYVS